MEQGCGEDMMKRIRWHWCARYGIGLGLVGGLLCLLIGSIVNAMQYHYLLGMTAQLGERFVK